MNDSTKKTAPRFRSARWFDDKAHADHTALYLERYFNFGLTREELQSGKPIIGIAQTGSDLTPCNRHHKDLAQRVKDGIRDAGGVPMEFPVHPIFEQGRRPTAALDRNLATLGLIEILHGYPVDAVVLTTGCDKTTPATMMAALQLDIPAIVYSGGPMLNGWKPVSCDGDTGDGERGELEERVGSGTAIWQNRERLAKGELDYAGFMDASAESVPSVGHCNTMGTALSMNALAEVLGMSLPGCAAIPAPYKERAQMGYYTGRRIVEMAFENLKPSDILTRQSFLNAVVACSALGGSTNAVVHLLALSRGLEGVKLTMDDWQQYGEDIPLLVNCMPAGRYLGEEFYRAGGVPALMKQLIEDGLIDGTQKTVTGHSLAHNCEHFSVRNRDVIFPTAQPLMENAGFAIMRSNFFDSALMKKSVINPDFRKKYLQNPDHPNCFSARAIVFEGPEDYRARIDDPTLDIDEHCILVVRNVGPVGYPGSAEVVNMLPPKRLVKQGINCLPTLGDGRQSGTSGSPSILHISPEAAVGGGIALLKTGDWIEVNLATHRVDVKLSDEELAERRQQAHIPVPVNQTPWQEIYRNSVSPLDTGAVMETEEEYVRILDEHPVGRHSH
ncbi:IlvD/Edd family dehydratase [Microbulbifer hydrolyticus]|uniref:Dihydroxy-acid dehydratase n=1 Tax=Microbulbifer hydrolyticus TaxID=48074 RepID=A0A6P1TFD1_9GAMM|nr:IlvD/Edd family dehydratase [Microbulbifer hydrolyticus]MBB5213009.1 dihydroxy-acid dehydratase [Microbulbifer hydrolyticus]QHQ40373.1 dihydroxy-acid dehydratase [Microbulbifer hydrolyticus]